MHVLQHCVATLVNKYLHDTALHDKFKIVSITATLTNKTLLKVKDHKPINMLSDISKVYERLLQKEYKTTSSHIF